MDDRIKDYNIREAFDKARFGEFELKESKEPEKMDRFLLDGTLPLEIIVADVTRTGSATKMFSVVANHGWAERILCAGCYMRDANDIAFSIGRYLGIPVKFAEDV